MKKYRMLIGLVVFVSVLTGAQAQNQQQGQYQNQYPQGQYQNQQGQYQQQNQYPNQNQQYGNPYYNQYQNQYGNPYQQQYTGQYAPGSQELYNHISKLIDDDLAGNKNQIQMLALGLSDSQKQSLITKYEKSAVGPFCLNLFVGYGIGSFVQGDKKSGARQCVLQGIGLVCIITGAIIYVNNIEDEYEYSYSRYSYSTSKKLKTDNTPGRVAGISLMCIGSGLDLGGAIAGCVAPWKFANNYNENLQEALNGHKVSFNLAPVIDPVGKNYGLIARLSF